MLPEVFHPRSFTFHHNNQHQFRDCLALNHSHTNIIFFISDHGQSTTPRPVFVYGTLRALPLLAWALNDDASKPHDVARLARPAKVHGYARYTLKNRDFPAVVKQTDDSTVDGSLLLLETTSQRTKLDDFEGDDFKATAVTVELEDGTTVDGDMYVWNGDMSDVSTEPWELDTFVKERLEDWIDLFDMMEHVEEDTEES